MQICYKKKLYKNEINSKKKKQIVQKEWGKHNKEY